MTTQIIQLYDGDTFDFDVTSKILTINTADNPSPGTDFSFVWLTDTHIGRPNTFQPGEPQGLINHVLGLNPEFIIVSGDLTDHGTIPEFQEFKALWPTQHPPLYFLPGNHDEPLDVDDPPPHQYQNYTQEINQYRWSFESHGYRFIGFTSNLKRDEPYHGFGWVGQEDLDFVSTELANMPETKALLFTHFPLNTNYGNNIFNAVPTGGVALREILTQHQNKIVGIFTGHRHLNNVANLVDEPVREVNGTCSAYNLDNVMGGFNIVNVTPSGFEFKHMRSISPYDQQDCAGIPNCASTINLPI